MATQHRHTDAVATTGAKASVVTGVADSQEQETGVLTDLRQQLYNIEGRMQSERATQQAEVTRLNDIIQQLQSPVRGSAARLADPQNPQDALHLIITFFEDVALGGAASDLRKAVHHAALHLNGEQRKELREFTSRLKYAAEAVDQEAIGLAV